MDIALWQMHFAMIRAVECEFIFEFCLCLSALSVINSFRIFIFQEWF